VFRVNFDTNQLVSDLNNIAGYAEGFLQGAKSGEQQFAENLGKEAIEDLKEFIDANARVSPETLHHVYEWYQSGSPDARLFDLDYEASGGGLSINSTFRQSVSVRNGSTTPFYNKAEMMENGIPVIIKPVRAQALVFQDDDGSTVFTKGPVKITEPGGDAVQGSYEKVFDMFFSNYFTQSFLQHSQVMQKVRQATPFYTNFDKAKRGGRAVGVSVGRRWMSGGVA